MIQNRRYWGLPFLLALVACSSPLLDDEPVEILLGSGITSAVTRTNSAGVPDTQIAEGLNVVGVYVKDAAANSTFGYSNVSFSTDGEGALTSGTKLYYPANGRSVKISAYHPYNAGASDDFDFSVKSDQSIPGNYYASDLLYAGNATYIRQSAAHQLPFSHQLSKVTCTLLAGPGLIASDLTDAVVEIETPERAVQFNRVTGQKSDPNELQNRDNVKLGSFGAIIPPQIFSANKTLLKISLSNGKEYFYRPEEATSFAAGTRTDFHISLYPAGVSVQTVVADWTTGDPISFTGEQLEPSLEIVVTAPCTLPLNSVAIYFDGTQDFSSNPIGSNVLKGEPCVFVFDASSIDLSSTSNRVITLGSSGMLTPFSFNLPSSLQFADFEGDIKICDLSEVTFSRKGSNCFIVNGGGSYMFDATVIGNGTEGLLGEGIATTRFHTEDVRIAPQSAALLWQDVSGLISGVSLSDGMVFFTVGEAKGNALIAVYDNADPERGNILWSWHIWCTDTPEDHTYINYENKTFIVMDRNLGATRGDKGTTDAEKLSSYGLLYQWGRKDPFPGGGSVSNNTERTLYDAEGSTVTITKTATSETDGTISYALAHPTDFVKANTLPYDWYYGSNRNDWLWGNPEGHNYAGTPPPTPKKSIYDPCPAGYMVAPKDTWTGFTTTGDNSGTSTEFIVGGTYTKGWNFKYANTTDTAWYPAAGYRDYSDGTVNLVGSFGGYWSSSPYSSSSNNAGYLYFGSGYVSPLSSNFRAYGLSVRCVKNLNI